MVDDIAQERPASSAATASDSHALIQQARQALAESDWERAETLIDETLRSETPPLPARRLWVRIALQQGQLDTAMARLEKALPAQPNDPILRVIESQVLDTAGHPRQALQRINQAIPQWPESAPLKLEKLRLLQKLGRLRPALGLVRRLRHRWPNNAEVLMAVAQFYHSHGRFPAARIVLDRLLLQHPERKLARAMRQNLKTDIASGTSLSESLARMRQRDTLSPADASELLQTLKRCPMTGNLIQTCREALSLLGDHMEQLGEHDRLSLFEQAERYGMDTLAHRSLTALLDHGPRTPMVARSLFRKALAAGVTEHEALTSRLLRHLPPGKRDLLVAEFTLHTEGPVCAWVQIRQHPRAKRSLNEIHQLIPLLLAGGGYPLSRRYLRFCRRRWPDDPELRFQHAQLLMNSGYPQRALSILQTAFPASKRINIARLRASCLLELGQVYEAKAELDKVSRYGAALGILHFRFSILMMLGLEDETRAFLSQSQQGQQTNQTTTGHFSVSLLGMQLNDLTLFHKELESLPPGNHEAYLTAHYVYPASQTIQRHTRQTMKKGNTYHIPRRVVQFWNDRRPPHSVVEIMDSWSNLPGVEYQRFNTQTAHSFLRRHFGADYSRAFKKANNIAEGADFFRLCYLRKYGGIYADADDRLYGRFDDLVPTDVGLVCFREIFGTLANNVIIAAPEHPAIVLATEMALEALLAGDNENTWGKTGPGLLTRAVASYLQLDTADTPKHRVAILPNYMLRRQVQIHIPLPHKKTGAYWNAKNSKGLDLRDYFLPEADTIEDSATG